MSIWKKATSTILIHLFVLSSLQTGALQTVSAAVTADSPNAPTPANAKAVSTEVSTNPDSIVVSKDVGIIKSRFIGKTDTLVVHIQDAHCNYEAQTNIAKIIEALVKNNSLKFVSVEGADGVIDTAWFKAFPDAEIRKEVANYFMKKGEITGPEFLSITTDYPIKLFGAETRDYYIENLNAFLTSYPLKEETEKYLKSIKAALDRLQGLIYNPELKAMDSKAREYEAKTLQFNDYIRFLQIEAERHKINLRQYQDLFKLVNVLVYEKKIDFNVTDKERSAVIDELSKLVAKDVLTELVNKSVAFKVGKISSAEYYDYVRTLANKNKVDLLTKYPNLNNYIIYNSVYSRINNENLFNDIKLLETAIKEKLFENDDQRALERLSRHIDTLTGLVNIKLLNGEFDYYKAHKDEYALDSFRDFVRAKSIQFGLVGEIDPPAEEISANISKLDDFYVIAIKRDKAMVDNTLEGMKKFGQKIGVLVTGGFHSEGMVKLLDKEGVSYVVVCPNITKDVPTPYIQVLTNQRTSFEDILAGTTDTAAGVKQKMLAPNLNTWAINLSRNDPEAYRAFVDRVTQLSPGDSEGHLADFRTGWEQLGFSKWFKKVQVFARGQQFTYDLKAVRDTYIAGATAALAAHYIAQAKAQDPVQELSEADARNQAQKVIQSIITAQPSFEDAFEAEYEQFFTRPSEVVGSATAPRAGPSQQGAIAIDEQGKPIDLETEGLKGLKNEVNAAIGRDFEEGEPAGTTLKPVVPNALGKGVDIYVIPSLEDLPYLVVAHPGTGGAAVVTPERRIYMPPSWYEWYTGLSDSLKTQFLEHEIAHLDNRGLDEAAVRNIAGIDGVLKAVTAELARRAQLKAASGETPTSAAPKEAVEAGGVIAVRPGPAAESAAQAPQTQAMSGRLENALAKIEARREHITGAINSLMEDTRSLHGTLVDRQLYTHVVGVEGKRVLIAYDSEIDHRAGQITEEAVDVTSEKYLDGAVVGLRGTGKGLLNEINRQIGEAAEKSMPFDRVVIIAGDSLLRKEGIGNVQALGAIINVAREAGDNYVPVLGLYNLALRIAYDHPDTLSFLNSFAENPNDPALGFNNEALRSGVIRILPRIRRIDTAEISEAYKAAQAALQSL